ncbi:hypothetical protein TELCIR_25988 [Teladorsagia circumcincta]|uniref:Uncharacterized protein n=1 Tax=Teladorsagia circumcincta TaxID=45464 RepID=A0A2G9T421_TELCI|nr:hypothetical protein TELCIR_25988 [Teladorsagia circumcincta]
MKRPATILKEIFLPFHRAIAIKNSAFLEKYVLAKDTGAFVSDAGRAAGDKAKQAWDAAGQKAGELGNSAREAASNAAARGENLARDAKDWTAGAVDTVKRGGEQAGKYINSHSSAQISTNNWLLWMGGG